MTVRSDAQWPSPYAPQNVAPGWEQRTTIVTPYRFFFRLAMRYRFWMCMALLGPPAVALLLFALLPSGYRAQTDVIVTTKLASPSKGGGEADDAASQATGQGLVNAEADLLSNPVVAEQALAQFGIGKLYPDTLTAQAGSRIAWDAAIRRFQSSLRVVPAPQSGSIRLSFEHSDARIATKVLSQLVLSYRTSRTKILEGRDSKVEAATMIHVVKDLDQLEHMRDTVRTTIGVPELAQQRDILLRERDDVDARLRQTSQRVQALSSHLADLTRMRATMGADHPAGPPDDAAGPLKGQKLLADATRVHPTAARSEDRIMIVPDQPAGVGAVTAKLPPDESPIQLAPRLLNQFVTRNQRPPVKSSVRAGSTIDEARVMRDLRGLDSLEQPVQPRRASHVTAASRPRPGPPVETGRGSLQPGGQAVGHEIRTIVSARPPDGFRFSVSQTLTSAAPATIAAPEVWSDLGRQPLVDPAGEHQSDPLIRRFQPLPVVQDQVGGARAIPVNLPVPPLPGVIAIDQDLASAQAELDAVKSRQAMDVVLIGLTDQKLVRLGQAGSRLNLLDAQIADQLDRVTATRKLYDSARAVEAEDQVGIGEVYTSNEAIAVSPIGPAMSTMACGSALASLFLALVVHLIARRSGRRSIALDGPLELFLHVPKSGRR